MASKYLPASQLLLTKGKIVTLEERNLVDPILELHYSFIQHLLPASEDVKLNKPLSLTQKSLRVTINHLYISSAVEDV